MFYLFLDTAHSCPKTRSCLRFPTEGSLFTPAVPELSMSLVHGLLSGVTLVSPAHTQQALSEGRLGLCLLHPHQGQALHLLNSCKAHLISLWRRVSSGVLSSTPHCPADPQPAGTAGRAVASSPTNPLSGTRKGKESLSDSRTRKSTCSSLNGDRYF